ncbi:Scarecrow-like protein 33 [Linum perenne]
MNSLLQEIPNSINTFKFQHPSIPYASCNRFTNPDPIPPSDSPSSSSSSSSSSLSPSEGDYPNNNAVLKYISDMLMEEDLDGKSCMYQDCFALQAAEKSLYDALGKEYPQSSSPCFSGQTVTRPGDGSDRVPDIAEFGFRGSDFRAELKPFSVGWTENPVSDDAFNKASIFAPDRDLSPNSGNRKNHERDELGFESVEDERSNKQSAVSQEDDEPEKKMLDEVLLCSCKEVCTSRGHHHPEKKNGRGRKNNKKRGEVIDLWTLLTQCAQAVASSDQRTTNELLKQIRQHSSEIGDGNQRMAHYFANALETRLAGAATPKYTVDVKGKTPMTEILKAYQMFLNSCPFKRMSNFFANRTVFNLAENVSSLHIIDFGILYGFQWPCLIQRLSERPGGPPKLRITGIDFPQPGFRPTERVEETGRRLARYCERFSVPFEYKAIAQKWETITYEDLNIDPDETTVVNCLYRMRNLPDDTVAVESARDAVLGLIHRVRPQVFIHGIANGSYNAPFFVTRFREALFHYSSLFDMFEATVQREDDYRLLFEREMYGRDIMNVVACEGAERVERPETYKQWQTRNTRAGFRQLPLDEIILKKVRSTVKSEYDKDFGVDADGRWMLQGWKGRIIYGLSVWKPVDKDY